MAVLTITTPLQLPLSELPAQELLKSTSASRIHPGDPFTATISPYEIQAFATDSLQTWPTQRQSPRLRTPAHNTIDFPDQHSDFILFPKSATAARTPQPTPARRSSELAQATSPIALDHRVNWTNQGQQQLRLNSTQQSSTSSASPIQNPRVSGIVHGTGFSVTSPSQSNGSPIIGQKTHFYVNSAPSSSVELQQQSSRARPPVPLFSNSTGSIPQATMAQSNEYFEGSFTLQKADTQSSNLTSTLDASLEAYGAAFDATTVNLLDGSLNLAFANVNDQLQSNASNVETVSPKDIMGDSMSAPPSGTFTDLTTPGTTTFDSPYDITHSTDTSPLFPDNQSFGGEDADYWPPLFTDIEEPVDHAPVTQKSTSPKINSVAPKMSRNNSSPGQSSNRSSNQGRHSFAAGVHPRRRDKPLPPITVEDPTDTAAVKRARNTLAARKSREKRLQNTEALMAQVTELQVEVEHWKNIALNRGHAG